jgi:hypothetical protein
MLSTFDNVNIHKYKGLRYSINRFTSRNLSIMHLFNIIVVNICILYVLSNFERIEFLTKFCYLRIFLHVLWTRGGKLTPVTRDLHLSLSCDEWWVMMQRMKLDKATSEVKVHGWSWDHQNPSFKFSKKNCVSKFQKFKVNHVHTYWHEHYLCIVTRKSLIARGFHTNKKERNRNLHGENFITCTLHEVICFFCPCFILLCLNFKCVMHISTCIL